MTTSYPTSLDSYMDKIDNVSTVLATSINNMQDALNALQIKVGVNNSNVSTSLDYIIGNFFEEDVRQMYFYQLYAPVGWTTTGVATNCVIGLKGGSYDWNATGGLNATLFGVWDPDDIQTNWHVHQWADFSTYGYGTYTYESDGTTLQQITSGAPETSSLVTGAQSAEQWHSLEDWWTENRGHTHEFDGTWRPRTALGILAQYEGGA